jgi:hypothetical protein
VRDALWLVKNWKNRQFDNGFVEDETGNLIKNDKRFKVDNDYVRFQLMIEGEGWITKDIFKPPKSGSQVLQSNV